MSLVLSFHCLLLNMFRMLVHPSSGACDLLWIYFMCCIALVRCVLVLRCFSSGVVWYPYAGWSKAVNSEIIKQVTSSWPIFIQLYRHVFIYINGKTVQLSLSMPWCHIGGFILCFHSIVTFTVFGRHCSASRLGRFTLCKGRSVLWIRSCVGPTASIDVQNY